MKITPDIITPVLYCPLCGTKLIEIFRKIDSAYESTTGKEYFGVGIKMKCPNKKFIFSRHMEQKYYICDKLGKWEIDRVGLGPWKVSSSSCGVDR